MKDETKNLFLAIALSIVVLVGWQYFVGAPKLDKQRAEQQQAQQVATVRPNADVAPRRRWSAGHATAQPGQSQQVRSRRPRSAPRQALAASPRVAIETKSLVGSISPRPASTT